MTILPIHPSTSDLLHDISFFLGVKYTLHTFIKKRLSLEKIAKVLSLPFELPAYRFCLERLELLGDAAGSPNGDRWTLWGTLNASQFFTFFVGPKFWMFRVVTNLKSIRSYRKFMYRIYKSMIFTTKNIFGCEFCPSPRPEGAETYGFSALRCLHATGQRRRVVQQCPVFWDQQVAQTCWRPRGNVFIQTSYVILLLWSFWPWDVITALAMRPRC